MTDPSIVVLSRTHVSAWVNQERSKWADIKYEEETPNREMIRNEIFSGQFSDRVLDFALGYIMRAKLQGLDTPNGRQALGKAIVTLTHFLETAVEYHGSMPEPGVPSGEINQWNDCPVPLPGGSP